MQLLDVGGDVGSLVQYMKALNFQSVGSAKSLVGRPGVGPPDTAHLLMKLEYRYGHPPLSTVLERLLKSVTRLKADVDELEARNEEYMYDHSAYTSPEI